MPMVFYASLAAMLIVTAISRADELPLAAAVPVLAGCAMTKFEGVVYSAVWFCVLLPFFWRHGWLKKSIIWKSTLAAVICLLPYVWCRLDKPVPYPLSDWWRTGMVSLKPVLVLFPQGCFLNFSSRFFNGSSFHWLSVENSHLQWAGKWTGLNSLVNEQLGVLPWLLLILLALSLGKKRDRLVLASLTAVMLGVFAILSFVVACLAFSPDLPDKVKLSYVVDYSGSSNMGRYFYPFFTAWFLGIVAVWFNNLRPPQPASLPNSPRGNPRPTRATSSQKQR